MRFGPVPIDQAEGKILGHNIAGPDGRRVFRKGRPLTAADVTGLREIGRTVVYVAELAGDDVGEDEAARVVAAAMMGPGLQSAGAAGGRVNLLATGLGLLRLDAARLHCLNDLEGLTLATVAAHSVVRRRQMAATIKVIPFALPAATVARATGVCGTGGPILRVDLLPARAVSLILSGSSSVRERVVEDFEPPLSARVESLGSAIASIDFVPLEDESGEAALAEMFQRQAAAGAELIVLAGETAIMDRHDIAPRAIERAGGEVACFGAPVDPGNLLLVAYLGATPILGAPGCARSRKVNVVDWVLPRLLAGDRLARADIVALGAGGLLEDVPERPMPRSRP